MVKITRWIEHIRNYSHFRQPEIKMSFLGVTMHLGLIGVLEGSIHGPVILIIMISDSGQVLFANAATIE